MGDAGRLEADLELLDAGNGDKVVNGTVVALDGALDRRQICEGRWGHAVKGNDLVASIFTTSFFGMTRTASTRFLLRAEMARARAPPMQNPMTATLRWGFLARSSPMIASSSWTAWGKLSSSMRCLASATSSVTLPRYRSGMTAYPKRIR